MDGVPDLTREEMIMAKTALIYAIANYEDMTEAFDEHVPSEQQMQMFLDSLNRWIG